MLYAYGARKRVDDFQLIFLLGVLLAYAQFPFWPSEPPRTVFPGEDAPSMQTIFRRFNWVILRGYGIHTSVFPSAHVSGAFAAAFGMMKTLPQNPWVGRFLLALAVLIATATVYSRYHYMVDALAGFGVGVVALVFGFWIERSWPV
jgi:membrane-associated phospholipid phosphatase